MEPYQILKIIEPDVDFIEYVDSEPDRIMIFK